MMDFQVGLEVRKGGFGDPNYISPSGPTYIAIRSAKHSKSSAYAHALDIQRLSQLPEFDQILKTDFNTVKPVMITTVDGGPDENPRFGKTISVAIHTFKSFDLDALFLATNAPGRSAFNPVERRMAPLSRELSGLILPHDKFGSHLDSQGRTTDEMLEKKNFANAGETLSEVWRNLVIDGFNVVAEYVEPDKSELCISEMVSVDEHWIASHVRTSQYLLQVVKCTDAECCTPFRSKYGTYFPYRFLTPPVPLTYDPLITSLSDPEKSGLTNTGNNIKFCNLFQNLAFFEGIDIPYDTYCPSVHDKITDRSCKDCGIYFASTTLLKSHKKVHGKKLSSKKRKPVKVISQRNEELLVSFDMADEEALQAEWVEVDELLLDGVTVPDFYDEEIIPTVNYAEHFRNRWESDTASDE
ncbi:uncharacterized protein LOC134212476 [Armigeres subalbatus]|uniref:uncharacterized protein LOC134212476 n=1 Tax=Armigeres subalbatus TaxID=124917 RepID=UPI002ED64EF1